MLRYRFPRMTSMPVVLLLLALFFAAAVTLETLRERRGFRKRVESVLLGLLLGGYLLAYLVLTLFNRVHLSAPQLLPEWLGSYRKAFVWEGGLRIAQASAAKSMSITFSHGQRGCAVTLLTSSACTATDAATPTKHINPLVFISFPPPYLTVIMNPSNGTPNRTVRVASGIASPLASANTMLSSCSPYGNRAAG